MKRLGIWGNLNSVTIDVFVDLVAYLPLLDLKVLASNPATFRKASQLLSGRGLNPRWGMYYTYLTAINETCAKRFVDG